MDQSPLQSAQLGFDLKDGNAVGGEGLLHRNWQHKMYKNWKWKWLLQHDCCINSEVKSRGSFARISMACYGFFSVISILFNLYRNLTLSLL